jgi:hypothetical protein
MGLALPLAAWVGHWALALPVLGVIGALGGALVVPLNALLQHRGCTLLTAGRSIAVQNFNENLSVLVMLAAFAGVMALGMDVRIAMAAVGLLVAACMAGLFVRERQRHRRAGPLPNAG